MEWLGLASRTLLMYTIIFIIYRIMGKREIGQLSVLDLVVSIMIAELAVVEIEDVDSNLAHGLVPIAMLFIIQIGTAIISLKSRKLRLFLDGKPSIIIANGEIIRDEMKKQRYNLDDLLLQLREAGITNIADVEFAVLENTGKLSIIQKDQQQDEQSNNQQTTKEQSKTPQQSNAHQQLQQTKNGKIIPSGFRYEMLPIPLIMDGKVQDENLEKINQNRFWLKGVIQKYGAKTFKDVSLCTIDHKEKIFVDTIRKNDKNN